MARPADAKKDQELINILTANARTSVSDIARKLGVSRPTVQSRLARLESEGVIAGYTTIIGKDQGTDPSLAAIILIELDAKRQAAIIASLRKKAEIVQCYTLSGHFDLFVKIKCATSSHLDEVIDWIGEMEGVRRTTSSILLARRFER
jgi:DNA-binding Lrp family transcriptional regulator